jgi:peptidoglycan/xylan/chitin deacetylase (PgdA/CDA1 family)
MEALAREGYRTLGSTGLSERRAGDGPAVALTFDDGYDALARHAFPVLADLGLRALVFVVTDYVGRDNDWDVHYGWRRFRHLAWDDLGRWQGRAIEVHSHGATHARLTWLADAQVEDELGRSRDAIARQLGSAPAGVAYPFGAVDARVRALAAAAGYSLGFAGPGGARGARAGVPDPLLLPRRPVYTWDGFAPPCVLREGAPGRLAMAAARLAHGGSIATSVIRRVGGSRATARA